MKDDYEEALDFDKRMKRDPFRKVLFDNMLKMVEIEGNEKILDVGVGTGILEEIIANSITTGMIIGLDKSKARLKVALSKKIFNTLLILSTAEKLPLKNKVVDYSFCILALHHFKNHLLALKEIYIASKKNGKLILCEPIGSLNLTINKIVNEAFQISHGLDHVVFNIERLEKLLNEAGFEISQREHIPYKFDQEGPEGIPMMHHWLQAYNLIKDRRDEELLKKFEDEFFSVEKINGEIKRIRGQLNFLILVLAIKSE